MRKSLAVFLPMVSFFMLGCLGSARPRECRDGCVEGNCISFFPHATVPFPGPRTTLLAHLETDCEVDAVDALGRPVGYSCFGVVPTIVTYDEENGRVATITQTDIIQDGEVEETTHVEFFWDADGRLFRETVAVARDTVAVRQRAWEWQFEGNTIVQITETNESEEPGDYSDTRFTDDGTERVEKLDVWDLAGHQASSELRAGLDKIVILRTSYEWQGDILVRLITEHNIGREGEGYAGCARPSPELMVCETELIYDDRGGVIAFIEAGDHYAVSDNCCGDCTEYGAAA